MFFLMHPNFKVVTNQYKVNVTVFVIDLTVWKVS